MNCVPTNVCGIILEVFLCKKIGRAAAIVTLVTLPSDICDKKFCTILPIFYTKVYKPNITVIFQGVVWKTNL